MRLTIPGGDFAAPIRVRFARRAGSYERGNFNVDAYSTVTDLAKLRGWSTSVPISTAV